MQHGTSNNTIIKNITHEVKQILKKETLEIRAHKMKQMKITNNIHKTRQQ